MIDHERIAALLDGRLGERERDQLLVRLAAVEDEYQAFAETASVLRELDEARTAAASGQGTGRTVQADAASGVISLATRRGGPARRAKLFLATAAGFAALSLGAALWKRAHPPRLDDPARAVALLGPGHAGPAPGWDQTWDGTYRGPANSAEPARAVRLGAYLLNLELASGANDSTLARLAGAAATLLEGMEGGGAASAIYRRVQRSAARDPAAVAPLLERGRQTVRQQVPVAWFELGVWAEAARTAAVRHDARFFAARASRAALDRAALLPSPGDQVSAAAVVVRRRLPRDGRSNWPELESSVMELLRAAGI